MMTLNDLWVYIQFNEKKHFQNFDNIRFFTDKKLLKNGFLNIKVFF